MREARCSKACSSRLVGLCGIPELLIGAIRKAGIKDLTIASNNRDVDDSGLDVLLKGQDNRNRNLVLYRQNAEFMRRYLSCKLELKFNPQGDAQRAQCGPAAWASPGFYTRTALPRARS
ncbi:CoA-transferase [Mesorhizobium sp. M0408]|uniref:CoA-transferase n=1 Tax=Mesorhizobium sp. M0408 TaxID=2956942 RepID=UPI003336A418